MDESAVNLGVWLAGGEAKMTVGRDSLNVLVIGARSMRELGELLTPLAKRLSNGLVCSSSFTITTNQSGEPALSTKIRIKQLPFGSWDLVLFAPRYCETIPPRELKQSVVFALQKCKVGPSTRLVLALPTNVDFHPVQLRTRIFGSLPSTTLGVEEIKGTCSEEDGFRVLEGMGFCEVVTQPLNCVVNIQKFTKNLPGGIKDLAEWLRASVDTCRQISPSELAILKKLCTAGELEIPQHKTVFVIPLPSGFEHDASAQPNKQAWWLPPSPTGAEGDKFVHFGLRHWDHQRQAWQQQPLPQHKPLVLAPKLTTSQMNAFVDSLVSQREDLPSKMPLTDLFEALADVWESGN